MLLILFSWLPCIILVIPSVMDNFTGWDCKIGTCGFWSKDARFIWFHNGFILASILTMIVGYVIIWSKARQSTNYLQKLGNNNSYLHFRNGKMIRSILLLILMTGFCNATTLLQTLLDYLWIFGFTRSPALYYLLLNIYQSQFALNFLIYAFKNDQYRKAYLEFWKYLTCQDKSFNNKGHVEKHTKISQKSFWPSKWCRLCKQVQERALKVYVINE